MSDGTNVPNPSQTPNNREETAPTERVVTRFAPSPTGFLHIGGGRTALFNWLLARRHGGEFRLRIEDTDRERSTQDAVDAILDGMTWLGLDWDGDVVYQHAQADRHRAIVDELLAKGHAYRCYCTPEELADMRAKAEAEKRQPMYDGRWRDRDPGDAPKDVAPAIRLRSEMVGETIVRDQVQGDVTFQNENLDDLIILRSDGNPTYNLAVVVDDHDMGITHVVRGVDHLNNAARQSQIYKALGWDVPEFAHVPLIHGPDGAKLSKRHGALGVEAYRAMGYLPVALRNYLVRLGWSHGDDEIFSTEQMVSLFGLGAVGKSPARFDFKKLEDMNGIHIRAMADDALIDAAKAVMPEIENGSERLEAFADVGWDKFDAVVPALKERSKTLVELINGAGFLIATRPLVIEPKAGKQLKADGLAHLANLQPRLLALEEWSPETIEAAVRGYCEEAGVGLGKAAQPLRTALTGSTMSPPIFDLIWVLGQHEVVARINDQLAQS